MACMRCRQRRRTAGRHYSLLNGTGNTGYAGYFTNTSTGVLNFGLYASTSSASGWAGYFDGAVNIAGNLSAANAAIGGTTTVNNITVTGSCVGCLAPGSNALSALTSATTGNTIDNAAYGQTWSWNSLSSGTAFTISSNSMTTGSLLSLLDTAASATSTGKVLSISDATTGAGYGVSSAMTGLGNTGYAGYFTNTSTSILNYGLYASTSSSTGYAGYFDGAVNVAGNLTVSSCTGCVAAGANSLSSLTSATTTNSIDNTNFGQTWKWGRSRPRRR